MEERPLSELLGDLDSLAREREEAERTLREINERAGYAIKAARQVAGKSQSWLAVTSNRTQAYVSQVESGNTGASSDTLRGIHDALAQAAIEGSTDDRKPDPRADARRARKRD